MASAWSLTTSPIVRSISVLTWCNSSDEGLTSSPKSSPWYSNESGWRETLSCSWAAVISWRLLVLVTLTVFYFILSILLRRRVRALRKLILVSSDEDSSNAAVTQSSREIIDPGLFWRESHALSTTLLWRSTDEPMKDNGGISLSLVCASDMLRKFVLEW